MNAMEDKRDGVDVRDVDLGFSSHADYQKGWNRKFLMERVRLSHHPVICDGN